MKQMLTHTTRSMARWLPPFALAGLLAAALGGCSTELEPAPTEASGPAAETLASVSQALGPEDGDFSECRQIYQLDEFNDPPPDLEVVNGRLRLRTQTETRPDLWVANADDATVSRISTDSRTLVGTYRVGWDPSRTAVDLNFDVVVANRAFYDTGSVTKINGDCACAGLPTTVCTSCREWQISTGYDTIPRGLAIDRNNDVWLGLYGSRRLLHIDGETGTVLATYALPYSPYGLAIDGQGLVWAPSLYNVQVGYNDWRVTGALMCFDPATGTSCGNFTWPRSNNVPHPTYGVAVDFEGNVWLGSWNSRRLLYLDRASFDAQREAGIPAASLNPTRRVFTPPQQGNTRGVAVDLDGNVWVADSSYSRIYRFNLGLSSFDMSVPTCSGPIGVGLSDSLEVWTMCQNANRAQAYDPAAYDPTNVNAYRRADVAVGRGPYSYSDFTGFALRNITAPTGQYRTTIDCGVEGCAFNWIDWDAIVPPGSGFRVQYRTSDDGIEWGPLSDPYDLAPSNVPVVLPPPRYIEIVLTLEVSSSDETPEVSEVVLWQCPMMIPPRDPAIDTRYIVDQGANNYAMRWAFTDASWPEQRFEVIDPDGNIRCIVPSTTDWTEGTRYTSGAGPTPGCTETGHPSNTLLERAFVAARRLTDGTWERSPASSYIAGYTNVNNPISNIDLQVVSHRDVDALIGWRRPQNNWDAGSTGALVEMATNPAFSNDYRVIAQPSDGQRGYASTTSAFGTRTVAALLPGTTYYVRITYYNGDGIPSETAVVSFTTYGGPCCYLDICVGVCADAFIGPDGCEEPPGYENPELSCDGLDNDCDGSVDEGLTNACGVCGPLPQEVCDGVDNDCDGTIDNNPVDGFTYFRDLDGDGWGDPAVTVIACSVPPGYVNRAEDCDDTTPQIHPGVVDICNYIDDDCDGLVDEDEPPTTFYRDADSDEFGAGAGAAFCEMPPGYSANNTDCDDTRSNVHPGAPEICDLLDNDCDGVIDEGFINATVSVGPVLPLDQIPGGSDACANSFSGNDCSTNYGAEVTITNIGTIQIPSASNLTFRNGASAVIGGPMAIGSNVPVGANITRTYCFGGYTATAPETLRAELAGTAANSCQVFSGTRAGVVYGNGSEICDGRDNDCDGRTDESPESCGVILDCVETEPGTFECVGTLDDE